MTEYEKAARLQRLNGAMDYITKHFAVVSVIVAVLGATLAIIFIEASSTGALSGSSNTPTF